MRSDQIIDSNESLIQVPGRPNHHSQSNVLDLTNFLIAVKELLMVSGYGNCR